MRCLAVPCTQQRIDRRYDEQRENRSEADAAHDHPADLLAAFGPRPFGKGERQSAEHHGNVSSDGLVSKDCLLTCQKRNTSVLITSDWKPLNEPFSHSNKPHSNRRSKEIQLKHSPWFGGERHNPFALTAGEHLVTWPFWMPCGNWLRSEKQLCRSNSKVNIYLETLTY